MKVTYENSGDQMTVQDAIELYELGVAVTINDGRDVTLEIEIETVSTSEERNMERH